ncbi:hypothetical protein [Aquihabitans sp. McL0605]|uniref:hypothetical protein n=1 Tax=Aquihabitans sp. McL0605 TaxID=3415671 RepID=UPI003CF079E0
MESTSLQFAATVRTLGAAIRARGLVVPGFRSPPRRAGAERTLRWAPDGSATVAVAVRGRPFQAVVADLIEGVVIVNQLEGIDATRLRTALWEEVVASHAEAAWPGAA